MSAYPLVFLGGQNKPTFSGMLLVWKGIERPTFCYSFLEAATLSALSLPEGMYVYAYLILPGL